MLVSHSTRGHSQPEATEELTRYNITSIHRIFIFNEAKPRHELDFCDFTRAMATKVLFNVLLGSCRLLSAVNPAKVNEDAKFAF